MRSQKPEETFIPCYSDPDAPAINGMTAVIRKVFDGIETYDQRRLADFQFDDEARSLQWDSAQYDKARHQAINRAQTFNADPRSSRWLSDRPDADAVVLVAIMVAAALAFEPEVFDVGIDIFGVTNWVRTLESIPPWWEAFKEALYDEMGDPATDAERHRRISPLFHADNIVRPLLVIQGANDPRVLQVESDELVEAVRANEVPVEYIVFPNEGHGFTRKSNRITASEAYVQFLDRYLR